MKVILSGSPKSTNHIYKSTCRSGYASVYLTPEGKALKEQYQCELEITVHLYFATKRYADWDNTHKLWQDSLNGIVWEDDSQIVVAHVYRHYDKHKPRIEVDVSAAS